MCYELRFCVWKNALKNTYLAYSQSILKSLSKYISFKTQLLFISNKSNIIPIYDFRPYLGTCVAKPC